MALTFKKIATGVTANGRYYSVADLLKAGSVTLENVSTPITVDGKVYGIDELEGQTITIGEGGEEGGEQGGNEQPGEEPGGEQGGNEQPEQSNVLFKLVGSMAGDITEEKTAVWDGERYSADFEIPDWAANMFYQGVTDIKIYANGSEAFFAYPQWLCRKDADGNDALDNYSFQRIRTVDNTDHFAFPYDGKDYRIGFTAKEWNNGALVEDGPGGEQGGNPYPTRITVKDSMGSVLYESELVKCDDGTGLVTYEPYLGAYVEWNDPTNSARATITFSDGSYEEDMEWVFLSDEWSNGEWYTHNSAYPDCTVKMHYTNLNYRVTHS